MKIEYKKIHKFLHEKTIGAKEKVSDKEIEIKLGKNGCKYIIYEDIMFMEQSTYKESKYAQRARNGEKITWGIVKNGPWILID